VFFQNLLERIFDGIPIKGLIFGFFYPLFGNVENCHLPYKEILKKYGDDLGLTEKVAI
jgi:hypothetical protein